MDNSFFVFTDGNHVNIERFHLCCWEFQNNSSLVEFGMELSNRSLSGTQAMVSIFIPWLTADCTTHDLYDRLSVSDNSRFIFNDSIGATESLDGGKNKLGVIHKFENRDPLCILPASFNRDEDQIISIVVDLKTYNKSQLKPNVYLRFMVKPKKSFISHRKNGISKSTIIYDIKVNERRNIPDERVSYFADKHFCKIEKCFSFNIIPSKYDLVFFENESLKDIRTLELGSFNKYLGQDLVDRKVKNDELIVVFNKKKDSESFSFFTIFSSERIGPGQLAVAFLINVGCSILFYMPSYRKSFQPELSIMDVWKQFPIEIYLAIIIALSTAIYFTWPWIFKNLKWLTDRVKSLKSSIFG